MSLRTMLIAALTTVAILAVAVVGTLAVVEIRSSVEREAQERVNLDFNVVRSLYEERLADFAARTVARLDDLSPTKVTAKRLQQLRDELELDVLNVRDSAGRFLAGAPGPGLEYAGEDATFDTTPLLREAVAGEAGWGTVLLDRKRLLAEGGQELLDRVRLMPPDRPDDATIDNALFWWVACPLRDQTGAVKALAYGGRTLNRNFALVDQLRDTAFGARAYDGKPLGTVTVFLDAVRVSTNVVGPHERRAIGTRVSEPVRQQVLKQHEPWYGPADVVGESYISAYEPLRDPAGNVIGMLYVGLLQQPYLNLQDRLIARVLVLLAVIAGIAAVLAIWLTRRLTRPLKGLSEAATEFSKGHFDTELDVGPSYAEFNALAGAFRRMQVGIRDRDARISNRNRELTETNEELARANRNYMEMLRFVTHELKSPLAAMQSMIDLLIDGYAGDVNEEARGFLTRIKRNCEELADMVKNYLDLTRHETGELRASKSRVNVLESVIKPAVQHNEPLLHSRNMRLDVDCPPDLKADLDPYLLQVAVGNYLSNAAKYGREGGQVRLRVSADDSRLRLAIWNEGDGFTEEERERLFGKFSRLHNMTTRGKRGSGVGLFLCKRIAELHDGDVWAQSQPGEWAEFGISVRSTRRVREPNRVGANELS